ncbi:spore coat protein GerQ [Psychrobacillus sp. OK032]|uniref:spore coat protein GerQ n=1 Tax=Psychrobacillus sp. OK032 TaxID=1884358 RepID=UPI0008B9E539|nr:spore coat protein GerQ [Psychrobacillus sp. OK032]SES02443.1 spore germination protein Q [Psychrobacillus sp. OK032]
MVQYYWHPGGYPPQPQQHQQHMTPPAQPPSPGRQEESYIENILRMNRGKLGTFYFTFENNKEWNAKVIKGYVEAAGRDHLIISDPNGKRYLMLLIYLDYVTFDEEIKYNL